MAALSSRSSSCISASCQSESARQLSSSVSPLHFARLIQSCMGSSALSLRMSLSAMLPWAAYSSVSLPPDFSRCQAAKGSSLLPPILFPLP
ncbi:hypothetical protein ACFX1Q_023086 [Malus domestica]